MDTQPDNLKYDEALKQLQHLVTEIESGQLPLDNLVDAVKQAKELHTVCTKKLVGIETEVNKMIENLEGKAEE